MFHTVFRGVYTMFNQDLYNFSQPMKSEKGGKL
uniref:Uncharacterized protein n=1 Tax=Siphoviridae sp. ctDS752 TaxID=2825386 RepID=A0A8S5U8E0_9CAUD|nr:MAG TPA: hypothetical protein [Siphoviridae sp. ctDS752]